MGTFHPDRYEYDIGDIKRISGSYHKLRAMADDGCRGCISIIDYLVDYERARKALKISPRRMTEIDCQNIADFLNGGSNG